MRRIARALTAVGFTAIACTGDAPTQPVSPGPGATLVVAPEERCFAVTGTVSETGVFPSFAGTISGDLVGTTATTAIAVRFTGRAAHQLIERTVLITGGSLPELVGRTLHESIDATVVFPSTFTRLNDNVTVDEGVRLGNLTEYGSLDASTVPWTVELQYHGAVCP